MIKYLSLFILALVLVSFSTPQKKILIIGDSISIGYTPFVKEALIEKAVVKHNPGNAQHSGTGLLKLEEWIGDEDWDIIQFNWGLWDLCYRHPDAKVYGNRDKVNGAVTFSPEEYTENLNKLVKQLKQTKAKLIFVTTSYVPEGEAGRIKGNEKNYNKAARRVMKENGIIVNDIHKTSKKIHRKYKWADGDVHYTKEGYKLLSAKIIETLENQLN